MPPGWLTIIAGFSLSMVETASGVCVKNAYRNPPPTITAPPIPNYLYGAFAPDQRIKPPKPKAQKPAPPPKGTFKYINDLTSAMFNIHGSKKNKVYGSLGFFRPLS